MGFFKRIFSREKKVENEQSLEISVPTIELIEETSGVNEITKHLDNAGLTPPEILMLSYLDNQPKKREHARFWNYSYNEDPEQIVEKLISLNILTVHNDLELNLNKLTIPDLKLILTRRNLGLSGKKQDLIYRILQEVDQDELSQQHNKEFLKLTDRGRQILQDNDHIIFFHRNSTFEISIYQAQDVKNKYPNYSVIDIARKILFDELHRISAGSHIKKARNVLFRIADFHKLEGELPAALNNYLVICYIDTMGYQPEYPKEYALLYTSNFYPYRTSSAKMAPGIISQIIECKVMLNLSDLELKERMRSAAEQLHIPQHLFGIERASEILIHEINGNIEELEKIYQ